MNKLKEEIQTIVNIYKSGNLYKAEQDTKKLIVKNPRVAFLYNLMGLILAGQKKIEEAIQTYEKGLEIDPKFAMIYNNLGLIYFNKKSSDSIKKSEDFYKKALSLDEKIPEAHTNLGNLYNFINKSEDAIDCHKKAIKINPKLTYAYLNLANVYVAIGNFAEAKKILKEAIKLDSNFFYAHRLFSRINKYTKEDEHINELERIFNDKNIKNPENKMYISFALGKAYEDISEFNKSFSYYKEGNYLFRKKINFSLSDEKIKFSDIKMNFNEKIFNSFLDSGSADSSSIFITGMPRSGTTLVEQILSNHSKVFGGEELEYFPDLVDKNFKQKNGKLSFEHLVDFKKERLREIGENYLLSRNKISDDSKVVTDKMPINFLFIGLIKLVLPNSKIIHCERNPQDNVFSIFKNHFAGKKLNFGYDLDEIIQYYNLYRDLMKYWNKLLPNFIFNIKYENLINNTKNQIQSLLNFCNLNWENSCLDFHKNKRPIKTASDIQARSQIYNTSIDSWKRYEIYIKEDLDKIKY